MSLNPQEQNAQKTTMRCDSHSLVCPDLRIKFAIGEGNDPELKILYKRDDLLGFLKFTHGYPIYLRNNYAMTIDDEFDGIETWGRRRHGSKNNFYRLGMTDAEIAEYIRTGLYPLRVERYFDSQFKGKDW